MNTSKPTNSVQSFISHRSINTATALIPSNTGLGAGALQFNVIGAQNAAVGASALYSNYSGNFNAHESRFQRLRLVICTFLGRCPRLV